MKKTRIRLGERSYDVLTGSGLLGRLGAELRRRRLGTHPVVLSNRAVLSKHGAKLLRALKSAGYEPAVLEIPDSERSKSLPELSRLLGRLTDSDRPGRRLFLVLAGGGVTGDLGGLAAGLYRRGIPYAQVPTTLLAQVDSSIGGKTAVDLPQGKNLVGLFNQPKLVLIDPDLLRTLPDRQFRSGLAEIIKAGIIGDARLFSLLEKSTLEQLRKDKRLLDEVISRAVAVKAAAVEKDERETGKLRVLLNLGHTFGHALEASVRFSRAYTHGEAVALGILVASGISLRLGRIRPADHNRIAGLIGRLGLPVGVKGLAMPKIFRAMAHDKKWAKAKNRWVLPERIGRCTVKEGVPQKVVEESIMSLVEG